MRGTHWIEKQLSMRRRLMSRIRGAFLPAIYLAARLVSAKQMDGAEAKKILTAHRGKLDRAQWQRWYQTNKKRQRQMAAYKRLRGVEVDPKATGLPRVFVP